MFRKAETGGKNQPANGAPPAIGMTTQKKSTPPQRKTKKRPSAGRPRAKEASTRLDNILSVAAQVFLSEGFDGASVGAIAKLAGASKETLYARFSTKEELFEAVITRKTEILLQKFSRVLVQDRDTEAVLISYGLNLLNMMLSPEMQRLSRTLIAAAPKFPELAERFWKLCPELEQGQLAAYFETLIHARRLKTFDPRKAAELFFSLCLGQFLFHAQLLVRNNPSPKERKAHIEAAVRMFLAAYHR